MSTVPMKRPAPPNKETVADWQVRMRQAFLANVDEACIADVVKAMVEKARKGDLAAARLLLTYAIGSPTVMVENALIVGGSAGLDPTPRATMPPGTPEKIDLMSERAKRGLPLTDPRDAGYGEGT